MNVVNNCFTLAIRNLRYFQRIHFTLALVLCCGILYIFGYVQLSETATMQILGRFFPLLSLVLITPIINHELKDETMDVIHTKSTSHRIIVMLRLANALCMTLLLYASYVGVLIYSDSTVSLQHVLLSAINLCFLGSLGLLVVILTRNITMGYMISIAYYLMNFFVPKSLGQFYLFQMQEPKWELLYAMIGLLGVSIYWVGRRV
jgi:ABC-type transport system involved in multi-copper enzyme maturation permease subunit